MVKREEKRGRRQDERGVRRDEREEGISIG